MAREPARPPPPPPADPSSLPPASYGLVYTLTGHTSKVASVKFSPDGTKLASSGADGLVNIWDSKTGQHLRALYGHELGVSDIAFSSDSRFIASGSNDHSVRLWSVELGTPVHEPMLAHQGPVLCLAFNPQGNRLASGGKDECVWLWDVRKGKAQLTLPAHSDPVSGVHFNRDGTMLVSCSWDGLIRMWDTSSGQCLKTLVHDDSVPIAHVSFSPNGRHLLSTSLDHTTRLWNYHTSKCMKTYTGATLATHGCPSAFMLHPRRRRTKKTAQVDVKGKGKAKQEDEEGDQVEQGGGGEEVWIVGGSEDGRVLAWEVQSRTVVLDLKATSGAAIISVAVHPTLPRIASASLSSDHSIRVWDHAANLPPPAVENDEEPSASSNNGNTVAGVPGKLHFPVAAEEGRLENIRGNGIAHEMLVESVDGLETGKMEVDAVGT